MSVFVRWIGFSVLLSFVSVSAADDSLRCLAEPVSLYDHLRSQVGPATEKRWERFESLKSPQDIDRYQRRLRTLFIERLGGFPERTPLNAKTTAILQADGYRIENVIFESRPQHHVTANLYLPAGEGPFPGIVIASGHSRTAKTADYNQRYGIMMALNGMAALCFDPIGQGERSQILDREGNHRIPGTTTEHLLMGVGSILVGRNTASYQVWDVMRSIDYLVGRPEIDSNRIGMAGCSGGGTQTSYAMALDSRIVCAAPSCYLTTFERLIETIGPQDAEQNVFGQLAFGLDQPDYVILRAPKPTLISSTTDDFFDIGGTWQNFRQGKRIFGRLGRPEQIDLVEIEGKHGVTPQNLATTAHWMKRWLLDRDEPVNAVLLETRPAEELICTESGQVLTLAEEKSVFDLNTEQAERLAMRRRELWKDADEEVMRRQIAEKIHALMDVQTDAAGNQPEPRMVETLVHDGYTIEKRVLKRVDALPLPMLVFRPDDPGRDADAILFLQDQGKQHLTAPGEQIESWIKLGYTVMTLDLSGQGETASPNKRDEMLTDWKTFYVAYLLGQSIVGIQVEDVADAAPFASTLPSGRGKLYLVGDGQSGTVALHAGALLPDRFANVVIRNSLHDWTSLVSQSVPAGHLDHVVHGALELYDLPDLVRLSGDATVTPLTAPGLFTSGIEGPACDREGNLYAVSFGDIRTIGRVTPDGNAEPWITLPEGSAGNGVRFDRAGKMYVADYKGHNVLVIDPNTKRIRVLAHQPEMHQPNDLAIADDGTLYASDPDWNHGDGALWKISPDGDVTRLADGMGTTNGIEVSPDGRTLYVAESRQRRVLAFDLNESGISNQREWMTFDDHSLDGMRCDIDGNLYLTRHGAGLVLKVSPQGSVLERILLPGTKPSNLCFGGPDGRTVYVTEVDTRQVWQFRTERPGRSFSMLDPAR